MTELAVIVPTRGRPQAAVALADCFERTVSDPHAVELIFVVDADDPLQQDYHDSVPPTATLLVGARARLGPTLNRVASMRKNVFALGFMGDDHRPRTYGWDQRFIETLTELKTGFVYGNDLLQGPMLPTEIAMTSDIVQTLGWMVPPGLIHLYIDNAWGDLGKMAGCLRYLPDVVIEHMHPAAGKAQSDAGYAEVNSAEMYQADGATYQAWCQGGREAAVQRIIKLREVD